jgi:hypothetical protein
MIKIIKNGRTVNNLIQQMFGILLSIKREEFINLENIDGFFFNYENNFNKFIYNTEILTSKYGQQYVDLNELTNINSNITIDNYVQKIDYYITHKELFNSIITPTEKININFNNDDLLIHIRLGDYRGMGLHYYLEDLKIFYEQEGFKYKNIYVVSEEPENDPYLIDLKNIFNYTYINGNIPIHYSVINNCKNVLISQSSFSWLPAFLGNTENIYVIFNEKRKNIWNINPIFDDIDLVNNNIDKRFKKILIN